MGLVDIAILVILGFFILKGTLRGLLKEICSLLGLVLGGVFAFTFYVPLAQTVSAAVNIPDKVSVWGSFLAIFILVVFLFAVIGYVLNRFVKLIFLGGFNRLAGAVFGIVQGVVLLAMILLALNSSASPDFAKQKLRSSQLAPPFITLGEAVFIGSRNLFGR